MKMKRMIAMSVIACLLPVLTGCWYLAAGGAGAVAGYELKKEGYEVQSPITKGKDKKGTSTEPAKSNTK